MSSSCKLPEGAVEICKHFDINGDGLITKKELRKAFSKSEMSDKEIDELMKSADMNNDGKVNYAGNTELQESIIMFAILEIYRIVSIHWLLYSLYCSLII